MLTVAIEANPFCNRSACGALAVRMRRHDCAVPLRQPSRRETPNDGESLASGATVQSRKQTRISALILSLAGLKWSSSRDVRSSGSEPRVGTSRQGTEVGDTEGTLRGNQDMIPAFPGTVSAVASLTDWRARLGSNQQPLPSEGSTLSIELRAHSAKSAAKSNKAAPKRDREDTRFPVT